MLQMNLYLETNKLIPSLQSAYRKRHSTETALLRVLDGILTSVDHRDDVVLVMLDLSAAFSYPGLDPTLVSLILCYNGFSSYLSRRTHSVIIGETTYSPRPLDFDVPQGSILGPPLFSLYAAPLQDIIAANNFSSMFYSKDLQLYLAIEPND